MNRFTKRVLTAGFGILSLSLLAWGLQEGRERSSQQAKVKGRKNPVSRVSAEGGHVFIQLDASTEARMGLKVSPLRATTHQQELPGAAMVLSAQDLTELRRSYLVAATDLEKARANLSASQQEYQRLETLHQQDQNVSAKAVQAAEAVWRTDEANFHSAQNVLSLNEIMLRQNWGSAVGQWLLDGSPELNRLLELKDVLLQVSVPEALNGNAPSTATIHASDGKMQTARFLSVLPKVDPRLQVPSFLYVTTSRPGLAPGMTLTVLLPSGPSVKGTNIPGEAIVWWQGKAWAYVQSSPDKFTRREVRTEAPVEGGWFVTEGFSPGDKIVTTAAQQLLSEEFRSQTHLIGEEDEKE